MKLKKTSKNIHFKFQNLHADNFQSLHVKVLFGKVFLFSHFFFIFHFFFVLLVLKRDEQNGKLRKYFRSKMKKIFAEMFKLNCYLNMNRHIRHIRTYTQHIHAY